MLGTHRRMDYAFSENLENISVADDNNNNDRAVHRVARVQHARSAAPRGLRCRPVAAHSWGSRARTHTRSTQHICHWRSKAWQLERQDIECHIECHTFLPGREVGCRETMW